MATVTYVGEEEGTNTKVLGGTTFVKGEALEVLDYPTYMRVKDNPAFKVEGEVEKPEDPLEKEKGKGDAPGKPAGTPGKPGTGAPGQEKKPEINPLTKK